MTNTTGLHDLIYRIARGDQGACAEFDALTRVPLTQKITGDFGSDLVDGDIYEIVSQSILNMFLHAREYRGRNGDASAWAWTYQIARNQALKWMKTKHREVHFQETGDGLDVDEETLYRMALRYNPDTESLSVEEEAEEQIFRDRAIEILSKLTYREKLILHLYFEKEWTLRQIAEFIHVKPPRVTQIMQNIRRTCINEMAKTA